MIRQKTTGAFMTQTTQITQLLGRIAELEKQIAEDRIRAWDMYVCAYITRGKDSYDAPMYADKMMAERAKRIKEQK